ncbi:MAG: glycosyltransferase family 4 protein [Aurantibacter sp.]
MQKEIQNKGNHIVFLGETGFPYGLGAVQRMTLMAKSLSSEGCKVTVICRKGVWKNNAYADFNKEGIFEGIHYIYTSKSIHRPKAFFSRNIEKLKGMYGEFKYLKNLKRHDEINAAIISNMSSAHLLRYRLYSFLIGFPIILNFVELASSMKGREAFLTRLNDYIYDNYFIRVVSGALPISDKLMEYYRAVSPSKPSLKLPILCDFEKFTFSAGKNSGIVFLYCGAASYFELIEFVLDSFDQLKNPDQHVVLELILGGKDAELQRARERIGKAENKGHIRLTANLAHKEIPQYYSNASALLIPLRPTLQDEARFPHKIGEYLASGRPMITTAYGEINHYPFIDKETALVAKDYSIDSFAEKMRYVLEHPEKSKEIGLAGRQMGLDNFDYSKHGKSLLDFCVSLDQKKKLVNFKVQ